VGRELETALEVSEILTHHDVNPTIVNARFVMPFDKTLMSHQVQAGMRIIIIENHLTTGGFASIVRDELPEAAPYLQAFGWQEEDVHWGNVKELRERYGMTPEAIAEKILRQYEQSRAGGNGDSTSSNTPK
jgi:1-deoxy-D-xylulose-5-phosphate synthase